MKDNLSLQELKNNLDIVEIVSRYVELKKINSNQFQAKENVLRAEKTSSLFFYSDTQKYYDFGTGTGGDVLDFLAKVGNISLSDVINQYKDDNFITPKPIEKKSPIDNFEVEVTISSEQLAKEFDIFFEKINLNNPLHKAEVLNIVKEYLLLEANETDLKFFLSCIRYDKQNQTLVSGWYKNSLLDMELITYKRRRLNGGKWINRKGTHPNQTIFHRIYDTPKPVYIVEGARDSLTSILLGLNFIAIPTTSFKNVELIKEVAKDSEVIFICEDLTGYKAMSNLSKEISNSRLITFVSSPNEKIDLSDLVMYCNSIEEVLNGCN
jgi:hypothetical protein